MRLVRLLAVGLLALSPSLALSDDTLVKVDRGIRIAPLGVAFLISAEPIAPQCRGRTQNNGNQHTDNYNNDGRDKGNNRPDTATRDWAELIADMDTMHVAMGAVERSGDSDADFVRLMLPHHQGAIDMAKTELLHGEDPQMRRLAQEIVTDQQSEIVLMQLWLKQRKAVTSKK